MKSIKSNQWEYGRISLINRRRNEIEAAEIAKIICRPAEKGHIFEYIASQIFPIKLNESASKEGYDGTFNDGYLKDKRLT